MKTLMFFIAILLTTVTNAEVYRWVDSNGKTHYDDKKPSGNSDDITAKVKKQNIDTSSKEHAKLEAIFRKENAADRDYQQMQAQPSAELANKCAEAKDYLGKIDGRVQFIDEEGKPVHVSEEERKKRVIQMDNIIKQHCPT